MAFGMTTPLSFWTNFTIADYYVIAPTALGQYVDTLYLTSTCRAQLGTESLVAYFYSTGDPQFWIYDWSQPGNPWQVMIICRRVIHST